MIDDRLRELERRWRETGSTRDYRAYRAEAARSGVRPLGYVLVRSHWQFFNATNAIEARHGFDDLLRCERRPLLVDLRSLRYFNEFWPRCMGPIDSGNNDGFRGRWALIGVPKKVEIVMEMLGFSGQVRVVSVCPLGEGAVDLDRAVCECCGPLPLIEWGPEHPIPAGEPIEEPERFPL